MGMIAALYGIRPDEAILLNQREVDFLLEDAQIAMFQMATTNADFQKLLQPRLTRSLRSIRDVRGSGGGGVGDPSDDK